MDCTLVPRPVSYLEREGFCEISDGGSISVPEIWRDEAQVVSKWLKEALDKDFPVILDAQDLCDAESANPKICISEKEGLREVEGYELSIGQRGVLLSASKAEGVIRGAATLVQLALSTRGRIPSVDIVDYPRFSWRGVMLDTVRNFFSLDFIEKIIDLAALHKLNVFHWHLTDDQGWRLELDFAPEVTKQGSRRRDRRYNVPRWREGSYSHADIKRIVEFARVRHVTIVPEIEVPGHVIALLASHPEFSCLGAANPDITFEPEDRFGVFDDILCAGNDAVLDFIAKVLDEICDLFPGQYVHMGGDEAPKTRWEHCPRCLARIKTISQQRGGLSGFEGLQAWFMGEIAEMLATRGKRMVGWDEIVDGNIRQDVLVTVWRSLERIREVAKSNYQIVACSQSKACYLDHKQSNNPEEPGHLGVCTLEDSYRFEPAMPDLSSNEETRIIGAQANLWSELLYSGKLAEYMLFPRICALSEVFWTQKKERNYQDFLSRMTVHGQRLDDWKVNRRR